MRKSLIYTVFFILFFNNTYCQENNNIEIQCIEWEEDFSEAKRIAKKENKNLLIFFTGSDWCSPCKNLVQDFFCNQKFKELSDNFVLYEANFPLNKSLVNKNQENNNSHLKEKYDVFSYPTILILNSKTKELGRKKGYSLLRDTKYHFKFIEKYL